MPFYKGQIAWNKGIPCSEQKKLKLRQANLGKKLSKITKDKLSLSKKGKPKGKIHSEEQKKKWSQMRKGKAAWNKGLKGYMLGHPPYFIAKGESNPKWIKDRSKLKKDENKMNDYAYQEWSLSVKKRDNWMCKIGDKNCKGRLESHHILAWRSFPELRYELNNGITLCFFHHPRKHSEESKLVPFFQEIIRKIN
jgi:hypothetical protein